MASTAVFRALSASSLIALQRLPTQPNTTRASTVVRFTPHAESAATAAVSFTAPSGTRNQPAPSPPPTTTLGSPRPPTPVFPSSAAMANFLQSYGRMLQHVQTSTANDGADHTHDTIVSGDALAAAGAAVVERVHVGLMALLGHPVHGVRGGAVWCDKERQVERCLFELERDIEGMRAAQERPPRASTLLLATVHCYDAARLIRSL